MYFNEDFFSLLNGKFILEKNSHFKTSSLIQLKNLYPELKTWCLYSFQTAWKSYSLSIYNKHWVDWLYEEKDPGFLAYCYIMTRWPCIKPEMLRAYSDDFIEFSLEEPWSKKSDNPIPNWIQKIVSDNFIIHSMY